MKDNGTHNSKSGRVIRKVIFAGGINVYRYMH